MGIVDLSGRPVEILLVEDNPGDVRLILEALRAGKLSNSLHVARDGVEALEFLRRRGSFAAAPRPDLILLDLNLPKKSGPEVLVEIKGDPKLRQIPVIVLTASGAEEDVVRAYQLNANCYVRKPLELDDFLRVVSLVRHFWVTIVTLPEAAPSPRLEVMARGSAQVGEASPALGGGR